MRASEAWRPPTVEHWETILEALTDWTKDTWPDLDAERVTDVWEEAERGSQGNDPFDLSTCIIYQHPSGEERALWLSSCGLADLHLPNITIPKHVWTWKP